MRGARFTRVASETNPSARRSTAPPVYAPRSAISANQSEQRPAAHDRAGHAAQRGSDAGEARLHPAHLRDPAAARKRAPVAAEEDVRGGVIQPAVSRGEVAAAELAARVQDRPRRYALPRCRRRPDRRAEDRPAVANRRLRLAAPGAAACSESALTALANAAI